VKTCQVFIVSQARLDHQSDQLAGKDRQRVKTCQVCERSSARTPALQYRASLRWSLRVSCRTELDGGGDSDRGGKVKTSEVFIFRQARSDDRSG
jgi:hypothetical protein